MGGFEDGSVGWIGWDGDGAIQVWYSSRIELFFCFGCSIYRSRMVAHGKLLFFPSPGFHFRVTVVTPNASP